MSSENGEELMIIGILPNLVMNKIFNNLELEDKKNTRIVCQRWRRIFDDPEQQHYKFCPVVQYNSDAKFFLESYQTMDSVHFKGVTRPLAGQKFPDIQNAVVLGKNNPWQNIVEILTRGCQNVKSLKIDRYGFENVCLKQMSLITSNSNKLWGNLSSLELVLEIEGRGKSHTVAVELFLKSLNKLTQLSHLSLSVLDDEHSKGMLTLFTELYNFIGRHSKKLKSLEIVMGNPDWTTRKRFHGSGFLPRMVVNVSKSTQSSISTLLKLTTLKISHNFDYSAAFVPPCLLESATQLSKLDWYWYADYSYSSVDKKRLEKIINKNDATLIELNCYRSSHYPPFDTNLFRSLNTCLKLTTLHVENYFGWNSYMLWDNLKRRLKVVIMEEVQYQGWLKFLEDMASYFNGIVGFRKIEFIKLYTPPYVYDVPPVRAILALANFKEFLFWSTSNENVSQIRAYCAGIPDLTFSNKSRSFENMDGWETIIKKNPF